MTGRAKESVFSILSSRLPDARVLDLFAGSGSLGLEALSRGAADAVFVERSRDAVAVLRSNMDAVALGGTVVIGSVEDVLERLPGSFDVVFVDPPYADSDGAVENVLAGVQGVLSESGIVVLHRHVASSVSAPEFLTCTDERRYGDAVVTMYERAIP